MNNQHGENNTMGNDKVDPQLEQVIEDVGEAGCRLAELNACEGTSGTISVFLGYTVNPGNLFTQEEFVQLADPAPDLVNGSILLSGFGRRLRDIQKHPEQNLGLVKIQEDGRTGILYTSPARAFSRLSGDFSSYVSIHQSQMQGNETKYHAIVQVRPHYITYLSDIPKYQDQNYLNKHLLRWHTDLAFDFADGIGVLPFLVLGSHGLIKSSIKLFQYHRLVIWSKHGVIARDPNSVLNAVDLIEAIESGAHYEYLNLINHELADGLTNEEIKASIDAKGIHHSIY
ncbi:MAG TPA: class II aldolase/adducin family protein [Anaerolineaceae bacterium]|nr:class II aldolase/adducin family protein [Anaerolineaceae bacterium]